MECPNSKPHFLVVRDGGFHWGPREVIDMFYAFKRRYNPRGVEAKRRVNGSMLRNLTRYAVGVALNGRNVPFKMYKRIGNNKVSQIE